MKKRMKYVLMTVLLFMMLLPMTALAKDSGEADLKVDGNKVTLSLTMEDKIAKDVTSLRLQLFVKVEEGQIAPLEDVTGVKSGFVFNDGIKSEVKNWKAFKTGDNEYIIDLVISGTMNIFGEDGAAPVAEPAAIRTDKTVTIGTLTLSAAEGTGSFSAKAGLAAEESESGVPSVEYMEKKGVQSFKLHITNTETVTVSGTGETDPSNPGGSETKPGDNPTQPDGSETKPGDSPTQPGGSETKPGDSPAQPGPGGDPDQTEPDSETEPGSDPGQTEPGSDPSQTEPVQPDTGDSGDNTDPKETEGLPSVDPPVVVPPEETRPFAKKEDPKLNLSSPLAGSAYVHFSWKEIEGADGYEIRKIKDNGKKKLIATVMAEDGTEFEQQFAYNKTFQFRIRAFQLDDEGNKTYGKYGAVKTIQTPVKTLNAPGSVTAAAARASKKVTITWQNPANADGIRIYMRTGETGEFEVIRTIDGTAVTSYTVTKKRGETYTFRIVGYKYVNGQPAVFSNYSSESSVTTTPVKVSGIVLELNENGRPQITWKKVARADAYQVYRSETQDGTYTRLKTIKKRSKVTYTDKTAESGKTYYYKVRAYVKRADGKNEYGYSSNPQAITAK